MSITQASGWEAQYEQPPLGSGGKKTMWERPVVVWQETDSGVVGYVLSDELSGHLVRADRYGNFRGYCQSDEIRQIAVLPPGWRAVFKHENDASSDDVVLVALKASGDIASMAPDSSDHWEEIRSVGNFVKLVPPGEDSSPT